MEKYGEAREATDYNMAHALCVVDKCALVRARDKLTRTHQRTQKHTRII